MSFPVLLLLVNSFFCRSLHDHLRKIHKTNKSMPNRFQNLTSSWSRLRAAIVVVVDDDADANDDEVSWQMSEFGPKRDETTGSVSVGRLN